MKFLTLELILFLEKCLRKYHMINTNCIILALFEKNAWYFGPFSSVSLISPDCSFNIFELLECICPWNVQKADVFGFKLCRSFYEFCGAKLFLKSGLNC